MFSTREFENLLISAREGTSIATQELLNRSLQIVENSADTGQRGYHSWELVTMAVETIELLGTMLLSEDDPEHRTFHWASNDQLKEGFTRRATPADPEATRRFFRLPFPQDRDDTLLRSCFATVLHEGARAVSELSRYWLRYVDGVRWFRHFPAHLDVADIEAIDPGPSRSKEQILDDLTKMVDVVDVTVVPGDEEFAYQALTLRHAREAAVAARVAIQAVLTRSGNNLLLPQSAKEEDRVPKLYPFLLGNLSQENRARLARAGPYHLA